jgi:hypothetical protein
VKRLIVCLLASAGAAPADEPKKPVPTYTNEDLERVAPFRAETGALSQVAPAPAGASRARSREAPEAGRRADEAYWRGEAERVRERVRALAREAEAIRERIDALRERAASSRSRQAGAAPGTAGLERRLALVLAEARERQDELEDRARRAGALPGWLR